MKKIGIIVQRYGLEINGGAEYHARLIAEKISSDFKVEVFTTTALDYITWKHHYNLKRENINGIIINRFKVEKPRDPVKFGKVQEFVFNEEHSIDDEVKWLHEEGPYVPKLIKELEERDNEFSFFIFFHTDIISPIMELNVLIERRYLYRPPNMMKLYICVSLNIFSTSRRQSYTTLWKKKR